MKLSPTAGEAHWQLGITERNIGTLMQSSVRLHKEQGLPYQQAVPLAVKSMDQVERVRGYSPSQWAFGRNPTWSDELHEEPEDEVNLGRDTSEEFRKKLEVSIKARQICEEEILRSRIERAEGQAPERHSLCPGGHRICLAPRETATRKSEGRSQQRTMVRTRYSFRYRNQSYNRWL